MSAQVAVIMGSKSDLPSLKGAFETLRKFGVDFEARVISAHRTPDTAAQYAKQLFRSSESSFLIPDN